LNEIVRRTHQITPIQIENRLRIMLSNIKLRALPIIKRSYAVTDSSFEAYLAKRDALAGTAKIKLHETGEFIPDHERVATLYHLFEQHIALTDGSVIRRYSQYPRKKIVSLQDIKSNVIYNPYRPDLAQKKAASSSIDKFKEKFRLANANAAQNEVSNQDIDKNGTVQAEEASADIQGDFDYDNMDDFLDLLGTTDVTGETIEKQAAYVEPEPTKGKKGKR